MSEINVQLACQPVKDDGVDPLEVLSDAFAFVFSTMMTWMAVKQVVRETLDGRNSLRLYKVASTIDRRATAY